MLEGDLPVWFPDVEGRDPRAADPDQPARPAGRRARLPLLPRATTSRPPRHVPADIGADGRDRERARGRPRPPAQLDPHARAARARPTRRSSRRSRDLRLHAATELYLGVAPPGRDGRGDAARGSQPRTRSSPSSGSRRPCGWGRLPPRAVPASSSPRMRRSAGRSPTRRREPGFVFAWPAAFERIPDEEWVDAAGRRLRAPLRHGREPRLVPQPRPRPSSSSPAICGEGEVLIDYSGGTGILLDRLRLRIFDRQVGMVIVDSSPKFLRVARRPVPATTSASPSGACTT